MTLVADDTWKARHSQHYLLSAMLDNPIVVRLTPGVSTGFCAMLASGLKARRSCCLDHDAHPGEQTLLRKAFHLLHLLQEMRGAGNVRFAGLRLDVELFHHPVLHQHRIALRAHAQAAG